jgi:hypothetical protein
MTEKQRVHASGLDEYFWQILDGDLDIVVCFRESEEKAPIPPPTSTTVEYFSNGNSKREVR